jgi:AcrR family transcriptional regulator
MQYIFLVSKCLWNNISLIDNGRPCLGGYFIVLLCYRMFGNLFGVVMVERESKRQYQIIDGAFALKARSMHWSLADLAEYLGLSKTALYRHFKNREAIELAMAERFRLDLLTALAEPPKTVKDLRRLLGQWLQEHQGYGAYFLVRVLENPGYPGELLAWAQGQISWLHEYLSRQAGQDMQRRQELWVTIIKELSTVAIMAIDLPCLPRFESFKESLGDLLTKGLPQLNVPKPERLRDLALAVQLREADLPVRHRLFEAMAAAISQYGVRHTTIERIAKAMGTAKSSLYFYSQTKAQMLADLVESEMLPLLDLTIQRIALGQNLAERIYIIMMMQCNYLLVRRDLIPVFNWMRFALLESPGAVAYPEEYRQRLLGALYYPGGSENLAPEQRAIFIMALVRWAEMLSTTVVVQGIHRHHDETDIRATVAYMLGSMLAGDKEEKV